MKRIKKTNLLILILCFWVNNIFAQAFKDIFDPQVPITYLGIDFTHVKVLDTRTVRLRILLTGSSALLTRLF